MTKVYLADLMYDSKGKEMPLGMLCIYSYLCSKLKDADMEMFISPLELKKRIESESPDILMLSNYCWNTNLSLFMLDFAKKFCTKTSCVMGGPNIHSTIKGREQFMQTNSFIDFYVLNDGEIAATELVKKIMDNDFDVNRTKHCNIDGVACVHNGDYKEAPPKIRLNTLDEIPDYYSTNAVDKFFELKLIPSIQTVRGCPYSCSYCNLGNRYYNTPIKMSPERFRSDINWIVKKMISYNYTNRQIHIVDDNFGLFEEDCLKAKVIREIHDATDYPETISAYTPKIINEKILTRLEPLKDLMYISHTMQSFNMNTLKAINRPSMTINQFIEKANLIKSKGFKMQSELIYGLPLETRDSFIRALEMLEGLNFSDYTIYQLTIIEGSEIDSQEYMEKYGLKVSYRTYPYAQIEIDGHIVKEYERVVTHTDCLSWEDYFYFRLLTFLMRVRVRICDLFPDLQDNFKNSISAVEINNEVIGKFVARQHDGSIIWGLLNKFKDDAHNELLDTQTFEKSEQKGNIVHKYRDILLSRPSELKLFYDNIINELKYGLQTAQEAVQKRQDER